MIKLVKKLNEAAKAYYSEGRSIMSDQEYDKLYEELDFTLDTLFLYAIFFFII